MFLKLITSIFGTTNERTVKKFRKIVDKINALEPEISKLKDNELAKKTDEFRRRLLKGETLDDILPEAFAVVREVSKRTLGMRHFDVQLIGGIALHKGYVAEMKTGEGKTLVATLPVYLNALAFSEKWLKKAREVYGDDIDKWEFKPFDERTPVGKGVHVVTVNDYLAKRDATWMQPIYEFLGLKVGWVLTTSSHEERVEAYYSDITYGTNNEFGFDYLRDNMVMRLEDKVQRELHYAIVDEVDSILIDEARTPLIISGPSEFDTDKYYKVNEIVPYFEKSKKNEITRTIEGNVIEPDGDFWVDEKNKMVYLTSKGILKAEKLLGLDNIYADIHADWVHYLTQALRAHYLFHKEVDYVVKDGKVLIVDEFTGRILEGRRWSDGLHQAIEAKEGVKIEGESQTLATITFQNYFKMYEKLAGMTGTAETEAVEFKKIYNLDVLVIPTNKPVIREDRPDLVFVSERGKFKRLVEDIKKIHKEGHPILIGTTSIEKSEQLSKALKKEGIKHNVLNAKYHEKEAEIIAQAGRKGAVTIATNMAGRGTDIILGGNAEALMKAKYANIPEDQIDWDAYNKELQELKEKFAKEREEIRKSKGLFVIGTERHESRRIDNQLRGRAGRQGDPGVSVFYVSLEDNLMRIFGSDMMKKAMMRATSDESEPISHKWISKSIEKAQRRVEEYHFEIRKNLLEYDNVMNTQREVIYKLRNKLLEGDNVRDFLLEKIPEVIDTLLWKYFGSKDAHIEDWNYESFNMEVKRIFNYDPAVTYDKVKSIGTKNEILRHLAHTISDKLIEIYKEKEQKLPEKELRHIERIVLLEILDTKWKEQLKNIDHIKDSINLRGYAQKNPIIEFKREALALFEEMLYQIYENAFEFLFRIDQIEIKEPELPEFQEVNINLDYKADYNPFEDPTLQVNAQEEKPQPIRVGKKVRPNDPCPCGSGKKYKKCCGRKA